MLQQVGDHRVVCGVEAEEEQEQGEEQGEEQEEEQKEDASVAPHPSSGNHLLSRDPRVCQSSSTV